MTRLTNISTAFDRLKFLTEDTSWRWYGALVHKKWQVTNAENYKFGCHPFFYTQGISFFSFNHSSWQSIHFYAKF